MTRTLNLRIWNPLLCQLSYRRLADDPFPVDWDGVRQNSLSLDLMQRVLTKTRAELLEAGLDLIVDAALDTDTRAVIEITALRALEPHILSIS